MASLSIARRACFASLLTLAPALAACASATSDEGTSAGAITNVAQTPVKRQSIGNCWVYAISSWHESLHKAATGVEKNTSESWLTYWHWFEQLAYGKAPGGEGPLTTISTGGGYYLGVQLVTSYGLMLEGDFIAAEADAESSDRQAKALDAVNESLARGPLKDAVARGDRAAIRAALDAAWELDPAVIATIDAVFGADVSKVIDRDYTNVAPQGVIRPADYAVRTIDARTDEPVVASLADVLGTAVQFDWQAGDLAFNEWAYPTPDEPAVERREYWKRVQRALHDDLPVILSWVVDFNALTQDSVFSLAELKRRGPGAQGGHMTVIRDYQANVPGLGLLEAGKQATRAQMDAALSQDTTIEFFRVKNSWGAIRPDRWSSSAIPGYHDVELSYLDGPIQECALKEDGVTTDTTKCASSMVPMLTVVLPGFY